MLYYLAMSAYLEKGPQILDGRHIRISAKEWLTTQVGLLEFKPRLAIVQVGGREDSSSYVKQKKQFGSQIGVDVSVHSFPEDTSLDTLLGFIKDAQSDSGLDGLMVQAPIPGNLKKNQQQITEAIDPTRDPDGLTSRNLGLLGQRNPNGFSPATAEAVRILLESYDVPIKGSIVTVIGRSSIVGQPIALTLQNMDASVSIIHTGTPVDKAKLFSRHADIVIASVGKAHQIDASYFKRGQTVVDAGTNVLTEGKMVGDVDFNQHDPDNAVAKTLGRSGKITPVPGGVGQVTVPSLFINTLNAARIRRGQERLLFKMKKE